MNHIYLPKRLKVILPKSETKGNSLRFVAAISKNIESLGYCFSPELFTALFSLDEKAITLFYGEILPILQKMRGAHRKFAPMYPNFPKQVMEMEEAELYYNAIVHYWSSALVDWGMIESTLLPFYTKAERLPLAYEDVKYDLINLGNINDFNSIFTLILSSKTSISSSDKEIVENFINLYKDNVINYLPESIPLKENLGLIAGLLLHKTCSAGAVSRFVKTSTDVLRIAVSFSGGDVSLAANTKFAKFKRRERRFLLSLLENCDNLDENMLQYKNVWIRLGEILHPGEYKARYPKAFKVFQKLRNNEKIYTFNGNVEIAIAEPDKTDAIELLCKRPGVFARRLDHVLRTASPEHQALIVKKFLMSAKEVSTPVILQVKNHFANRNSTDLRPVFPKGSLAKMKLIPALPKMNAGISKKVVNGLEKVLINRFAEKPKLGKVYLDEKLKNYVVPFSQRSASKALHTIVRGSKLDLGNNFDTVRFFVWWKNSIKGRTDIDLSAVILDENFKYVTDISYYNLKELGGCHSGDITDAPNGAAEFIDISIKKVLKSGGRYISMNVYCYTSHNFVDLPECFVGWMGRQHPESGEIFEPKTVKNKIDITSNTSSCSPLMIDCLERKVIWLDLTLKKNPIFNNSLSNKTSIQDICKAMVNLKKTNLYDLFALHVKGRGTLVKDKAKAKVVFSEDSGITPFDGDKITSEYL